MMKSGREKGVEERKEADRREEVRTRSENRKGKERKRKMKKKMDLSFLVAIWDGPVVRERTNMAAC